MYKNDDIVDAVVTVGLTAAAAVSSALAVLTSWTGVGAVAFGSLATASLATLATYKAVRGSYQGGTRGALVAGTAGAITAGVAAATAGTSSAFGLNLNASYSFHGGYSGGVGVGYGGANVGVNYSEQGGWGGSVGYAGFGVRLGEQGSWGVSAAGLSYDYSRAGGHSYGVDVAGLSNDYGSLTGTLTYNNKTGTGFSVGATLAGAAGGLGANSSASWSRFGPGVQTSFGLSYTSPALAAQRGRQGSGSKDDKTRHHENELLNILIGAGKNVADTTARSFGFGEGGVWEMAGNWASGDGYRTNEQIQISRLRKSYDQAATAAAAGSMEQVREIVGMMEGLTDAERTEVLKSLEAYHGKSLTIKRGAYEVRGALGDDGAYGAGVIGNSAEGKHKFDLAIEKLEQRAVNGKISRADVEAVAREVGLPQAFVIDWAQNSLAADNLIGIDSQQIEAAKSANYVKSMDGLFKELTGQSMDQFVQAEGQKQYLSQMDGLYRGLTGRSMFDPTISDVSRFQGVGSTILGNLGLDPYTSARFGQDVDRGLEGMSMKAESMYNDFSWRGKEWAAGGFEWMSSVNPLVSTWRSLYESTGNPMFRELSVSMMGIDPAEVAAYEDYLRGLATEGLDPSDAARANRNIDNVPLWIDGGTVVAGGIYGMGRGGVRSLSRVGDIAADGMFDGLKRSGVDGRAALRGMENYKGPFQGPIKNAGQIISDSIVNRELAAINFKFKPEYNPNLTGVAGEATLGVKSEIGPSAFNPDLIGRRTMLAPKPLTQRQTTAYVQIHEELHQRIYERSQRSTKWLRLFNDQDGEHYYIDDVINRYFDRRGW